MSRFANSAVTVALAISLGASRAASHEEWPVDDNTQMIQTTATREGKPRVIHFIRIQKTASSTIGERMMAHFCKLNNQRCWYADHKDFEQCFGGTDVDLVTMLRHPVERTLSEFFYIRTNQEAFHAQWDFLPNKAWVNRVLNTKDAETALRIYLREYPGNPSQNRQTQYLVGFKGHSIRKDPYNWESNRTALLNLAKEHLRQTKAFGIVECMHVSVSRMAGALGWNVREALDLVESTHARAVNRTAAASHLSMAGWPLLLQQLNDGTKRQQDLGPGGVSWSALVQPEIIKEIEKWSSVDMEFYRFARQLFRERTGADC